MSYFDAQTDRSRGGRSVSEYVGSSGRNVRTPGLRGLMGLGSCPQVVLWSILLS